MTRKGGGRTGLAMRNAEVRHNSAWTVAAVIVIVIAILILVGPISFGFGKKALEIMDDGEIKAIFWIMILAMGLTLFATGWAVMSYINTVAVRSNVRREDDQIVRDQTEQYQALMQEGARSLPGGGVSEEKLKQMVISIIGQRETAAPPEFTDYRPQPVSLGGQGDNDQEVSE